jgi:hypothetical protein
MGELLGGAAWAGKISSGDGLTGAVVPSHLLSRRQGDN